DRFFKARVDFNVLIFYRNDIGEFPGETQVRTVDVEMLTRWDPYIVDRCEELFHPDLKSLPKCFQVEAMNGPTVFDNIDTAPKNPLFEGFGCYLNLVDNFPAVFKMSFIFEMIDIQCFG